MITHQIIPQTCKPGCGDKLVVQKDMDNHVAAFLHQKSSSFVMLNTFATTPEDRCLAGAKIAMSSSL